MYRIENFEIFMTPLNRKRMVRVYLPNDYDVNTNKHYKVLYMQDGHNLFYKETSAFGSIWDIQSTMCKRENLGNDGLIVVGVDCNVGGGRMDEYSPWVNDNLDEIIKTRGLIKAGGEGDLYSEFLVSTLKPYIDSKYRTLSTRENTFIAGSSMGAFISLYTAFKYPDIYSAIGAFSTAAWFKKDKLMRFLEDNFKNCFKIYLDVGTKETSDASNPLFNSIYLHDTKDIATLLISLGQTKNNLQLIIDEGASHSEDNWRRRFPMFLDFIL